MKYIISSATKLVLVFLMLVLGLIVLLSAFRGEFTGESVLDIFKSVIMFITGYYFSKRETSDPKLSV